MNFRRLFQAALLTQICIFAFTFIAEADEPLSMKIEMRHGQNGPRKAAEALPGESMFFSIGVHGLKENERGQSKISINTELRNDSDELVHAFGSRDIELYNQIGHQRICVPLKASIPLGSDEGILKLVVSVDDQYSKTNIKQEFPIAIRKAKGAHAVSVVYANNVEAPSSGYFIVGDNVFVRFHLLGLEATKKIDCRLTVVPNGETKSIVELDFTKDLSGARNLDRGIPAAFNFAAMQSFEGKVRLTIADDASNSNTVELPLKVNPSLGSDDTAFVADIRSKDAKPTKKE